MLLILKAIELITKWIRVVRVLSNQLLTNCIFVMISENFDKTIHTRPAENSMYVNKSFSKTLWK